MLVKQSKSIDECMMALEHAITQYWAGLSFAHAQSTPVQATNFALIISYCSYLFCIQVSSNDCSLYQLLSTVSVLTCD